MPLPADANVIVPGFAFAWARSSLSVVAVLLGGTISTSGLVPINVIGTKLFTASYGIFGYRLGLIACELIVPPRIV